jgi:hypothetical protein
MKVTEAKMPHQTDHKVSSNVGHMVQIIRFHPCSLELAFLIKSPSMSLSSFYYSYHRFGQQIHLPKPV